MIPHPAKLRPMASDRVSEIRKVYPLLKHLSDRRLQLRGDRLSVAGWEVMPVGDAVKAPWDEGGSISYEVHHYDLRTMSEKGFIDLCDVVSYQSDTGARRVVGVDVSLSHAGLLLLEAAEGLGIG